MIGCQVSTLAWRGVRHALERVCALVSMLFCALAFSPPSAVHPSSPANTARSSQASLKLPEISSSTESGLPDGLRNGPPAQDLEAEHFSELFSWMQSGIDKHVAQKHLEDIGVARNLDDVIVMRGRTIVAKRSFERGDIFMRLPKEYLLHAGNYMKSSTAEAIKAALQIKAARVTASVYLAVYLMEQRRLRRASHWYPFLRLLPESVSGAPVTYGDEEWSWLQGTTFANRARLLLKKHKRQYETVAGLVPWFGKNFTLEEFMWARSIVSSRLYSAKKMLDVAPEHRRAIVPIGDMFNHQIPASVSWGYNRSSDTFDFWMRQNVQAGQALYISYGDKKHAEFMISKGFVPSVARKENYTECDVDVRMRIDGAPDETAKRKLIADVTGIPSRAFQPPVFRLRNSWDGEAGRMLAYARLLMLPPDPWEAQGKKMANASKDILQQCQERISDANEQAALEWCLQAVRDTLNSYPTSLEEDEKLLLRLEGPLLYLVALRRDEKLGLRMWEDKFMSALEMCSGPSYLQPQR